MKGAFLLGFAWVALSLVANAKPETIVIERDVTIRLRFNIEVEEVSHNLTDVDFEVMSLDESDASETDLSDIFDEVHVIFERLGEYAPDSIYGGAAIAGDIAGYLGGVDWALGERWGLGLEYRYFKDSVSFARRQYQMRAHTGGLYFYYEMPLQRFYLRPEIGVGGMYFEGPLRISTTWVGASRLVAGFHVAERLVLSGWVGGLYHGNPTVSEGRLQGRVNPDWVLDAGLALRWKFGSRVMYQDGG